MKQILLTGGRAPVTLELARLFFAAGHTVFVAESMPWHICRGSKAVTQHFFVPSPNRQPAQFIDALLKIIRQKKIDLLIPTCEEIYYVAMGQKRLRPYCTVFTANINTLHSLHNKWRFIEQAQSLKLAVPRTVQVTHPDDVTPLLQAKQKFVLKPVYSRFAARAIIQPEARHQIPPDITPQMPWVAQEFVTGRHISSYSIVHSGQIVAHSDYTLRFVAGQGSAIVFQPEHNPQALQWVKQFVKHKQFTGQIAFDFIQPAQGPIVAIECNPRATSGIHLFRDNGHVANAFFAPIPSMPMLTPRPNQTVMLTIPMLIYGLPKVRSLADLKRWTTVFSTAKDAIYRWDDPWPGLVWQWLAASNLAFHAVKHRVTLLQASTLDIEWNGPDETTPGIDGRTIDDRTIDDRAIV